MENPNHTYGELHGYDSDPRFTEWLERHEMRLMRQFMEDHEERYLEWAHERWVQGG